MEKLNRVLEMVWRSIVILVILAWFYCLYYEMPDFWMFKDLPITTILANSITRLVALVIGVFAWSCFNYFFFDIPIHKKWGARIGIGCGEDEEE